jgi:hypothetical protein
MTKSRRNVTSEDLKNEVLDKITQYTNNGFPEAKRLHEIIMATNPSLQPRLWYGMPGYAKTKDSAVLCFFRKDTLISFGFTEAVDISALHTTTPSVIPSAWYITELDKEAEETVAKIVSELT